MKKTILSLFILATLGITSCSSDSDGTATDATNVNLPTTYEPTIGNINTYARTGVNENTTLLDLTGQNSNLKFELLTTENVVELSTDGRKIQTKTNLPQNTVGNKTIQYRVVQTGTSFSTANTLSFVVHYGENEKIDVVVNFLQNNPNTTIPYEDVASSDDGWIIKNVPWQYGVNETNYKFQLVIVDGDNGDSLQTSPFSIGTIGTGLRVCELSDNITNALPNPKNISYKDYNNEPSKRLYKLKVRRTVVGTEYQYEFIDGIDNDCDEDLNGTTEDFFKFGCTTI